MYIYICVCMYMYIYTHRCTYVRIYVYTHANAHTHIYIHVYLHSYVCVCVNGMDLVVSAKGLAAFRFPRSAYNAAWLSNFSRHCVDNAVPWLRTSQSSEFTRAQGNSSDPLAIYRCLYSVSLPVQYHLIIYNQRWYTASFFRWVVF